MNPKEFVHNTAYSVKLPYKAGLSLKTFCLMSIKSDGEIQRNKHFEPKKKDGFFHIFDQNKISRVRLLSLHGGSPEVTLIVSLTTFRNIQSATNCS